MAKKTKAHQIYRDRDGNIVPGVSTVVNTMDKPFLVPWANKLGLQGIDVSKYVDDLAEVGTVTHKFCEWDLLGQQPDEEYLAEFSKDVRDRAETCFLKFLDFRKDLDFHPLLLEAQLVHKTLGFGGTCDMYGIMGGRAVLIDIKTAKEIYGQGDTKFTQTAGYKLLLEDEGHKVDDCCILRLGRSEDEGYEFIRGTRMDDHEERFKICLDLYKINKVLSRRGD